MQDRLYGAVAEYNDEHRESEFDFGYFPTLIENVVTLLETLTDDTNHWISYWMFDLDCGRRYVDGSVRDEDGSEICGDFFKNFNINKSKTIDKLLSLWYNPQ